MKPNENPELKQALDALYDVCERHGFKLVAAVEVQRIGTISKIDSLFRMDAEAGNGMQAMYCIATNDLDRAMIYLTGVNPATGFSPNEKAH